MTLFDDPARLESDGAEAAEKAETGAKPGALKRPSRWSVRNWPVRWKVLAIGLLPMLLAGFFGGLRIYDELTESTRLRLVADRAEMIPAITNYMAALDDALVADSAEGDAEGAKKNFENRKYELQSRLSHTDVADDVRSGLNTLMERGQGLLDLVMSNGVGLRQEVTGYAPILLTAEDAINGSVRTDSGRIRSQTEGLSRAVGARGQMMMQQLLLNRGGELPEAELRNSMMTLAGTEPSTLFGMSEVLGVDSPEAKTLQQQLVARMTILSDPDQVLPNNPLLRESILTTDQIAAKVISENTGTVVQQVEHRAAERRSAAVRDSALVLSAIIATLVVVWLVARSLVRPLHTLRDSALQVAHSDLEQEIARVRAGDEREPDPLPVYTTEEVGQVAHAVDELHAQALLLAGDEARLRRLVNEMFETMSRRNRSLVDQQLALIDRLERNEDDPDRLESLFRLDHLAARMRRNGANLLVLAGARAPHERSRSVSLGELISAAVSEVEGYHRVQTVLVPDVTVIGAAAADGVHLLAELIDNALRYSPPAEQVRVVAGFENDGGVVVEIVDVGLGMTDTDLRMANTRLSAGGEFSPENARHMGLFVVSRLAHRHGIEVRLFPASQGSRGITAEVYLPPHVLTDAPPDDPPPPLSALEEPQPPIRHRPPAPAAAPLVEAGPAPTPESSQDGPVVSMLPRRTPGSSGITGAPAPPPAATEPPQSAEPLAQPAAPADMSDFFAARDRVGPDTDTDTIYQRMLNEAVGNDPQDPALCADLDWKSVWDRGWSVAAQAEDMPVVAHTEHGLPVREPGVRLVPGSAESAGQSGPDEVAGSANGASHRLSHHAAERDPAAIRASISSHFSGVHAARTQFAAHAAPAGAEHGGGPGSAATSDTDEGGPRL